ncbi:nicotinate-nucleotide--dimethylbenzimidazole phosphoribosyltransferase [Dyadobacter sp. Leaf189]|uniref:nicotinate-nucleotide--dimethylbenzimidazole phosphoribosyltransferase n=1 Tax=Dyadobacter sp. Leaf189 TaxID=1736295 RepID=UPI0006F85945|nr:nicotinate-nucleotide--dimethylbenzimidazole phosphoribosyltransferase [Dyadobacter sp. Leaf189]KQS30923.1 nicotinate-nucleotide--dimethylbenzimidazole phosphoribosyltransferase [Dyadobacter sp. Leaf189]
MQQDLDARIREKIDFKTKPTGALGLLEDLAYQIASVQNTLSPRLVSPHIIVFAASHGIAASGVSAYPTEVTAQMVLNFLNGGAAINAFTRQHRIELTVVDAGVDYEFTRHDMLLDRKIGFGTKNFLEGAAMTADECLRCLDEGAKLVESISQTGCNVIGFGEMGIGNTSSAAMIMSRLLGLPLEDCVGKGTGLDNAGLERKIQILTEAAERHKPGGNDPLQVLQTFGGFEIVMMCGAMLEAAARQMLVLVDGFIASAAYLAALKMNHRVRQNAVFCHQSEERGHRILLETLNAKPILQLGMRLGEGTGCAVAYPILQSAVAFFNEMASFESAGISGKPDL